MFSVLLVLRCLAATAAANSWLAAKPGSSYATISDRSRGGDRGEDELLVASVRSGEWLQSVAICDDGGDGGGEWSTPAG